MSDTRVLIWFAWFLASHWLETRAVLLMGCIAKGAKSMRKPFPLVLLLLFAACIFLGLPKFAAADDDPPGRVARLNYLQGSVSFQPAGEDDWVEADRNRPLTTGDNLWVDHDSRGEVHIGSTAIRLSGETGISFLNIDDRTVQIQLAQGTIEIHLRRLDPGDAYEIDTPNLAFTLVRPGEYRVETGTDGNWTVLTIREGAGEVMGGGESWDVGPGQRYEFVGTDELGVASQPAPEYDDFQNWCERRDQRENNAFAARYVSRDIDGYYDMDDYGDWRNDPDYGVVWYPRGVAYGWVPYHYGHWVFINPWGWTWVGEEAWGYAPYHYGRWVLVGGAWGWVPGPIVVRPVYAPHLVAFVGGGGASIAIGFGGGITGVAWFPLGPRDVWVPGYHCSPRYVQNVNITNTRVVNITQVTNVYNTTIVNKTVIVNTYTYANEPTAVTVVRREDFVSARPVAQVAVKVSAEQVRAARPVETAAVAPTRSSYVAATAKPAAPTAKPTVAFTDRKVVAKINPPAPPAGGHGPAVVNAEKPAPAKQPAAGNKNPEPPPHGNAAPPAAPAEARTVNPPRENPPPPPAKPVSEPPPPKPANEPAAARPANEPPPARPNNPPPPAHPANAYEEPAKPQEAAPPPQQHPAVKYTPPVKAKDEMYDVHPPANKTNAQPKPEEAKTPPKKEEKKEGSSKKDAKSSENEKDKPK